MSQVRKKDAVGWSMCSFINGFKVYFLALRYAAQAFFMSPLYFFINFLMLEEERREEDRDLERRRRRPLEDTLRHKEPLLRALPFLAVFVFFLWVKRIPFFFAKDLTFLEAMRLQRR